MYEKNNTDLHLNKTNKVHQKARKHIILVLHVIWIGEEYFDVYNRVPVNLSGGRL